jgi:hypothetical protein
MNMREWAAKIATIVVILSTLGALALRQRETTILRTVRGTVVDQQGTPLPSGVVYLHTARTHKVRTHITDRSGQYRFSGLHPYGDYEIHAKHGAEPRQCIGCTPPMINEMSSCTSKWIRKKKPKPFVPGDPSNGNMFVFFWRGRFNEELAFGA